MSGKTLKEKSVSCLEMVTTACPTSQLVVIVEYMEHHVNKEKDYATMRMENWKMGVQEGRENYSKRKGKAMGKAGKWEERLQHAFICRTGK